MKQIRQEKVRMTCMWRNSDRSISILTQQTPPIAWTTSTTSASIDNIGYRGYIGSIELYMRQRSGSINRFLTLGLNLSTCLNLTALPYIS